MDFDIKNKIPLHGKALKNDAIFSVFRLVVVYLAVAVIFRGRIDMLVILLMVLYGAATALSLRRRMNRERKYYSFEAGNPVYDYLAEIGAPEGILEDINSQIKDGKIIFSDVDKPNKTNPETIITEGYFVHLNKQATIIPLDRIVCAYLYDNVTRETPDERFLPTHFKPIFLIITYGEKREAIIKYSMIKYKEVLEALNNRLGCKVFYTRELGTLFNSDYGAFLSKVRSKAAKK